MAENSKQFVLYGDGIHDDQPAIQEMLDSGCGCVYLPVPKKHYLIGKTLRIHSDQELKLDRYTRICLADNSNCPMLENADPESWDRNITVSGGVWDMNHRNQKANPHHFPDPDDGLLWTQKATARGLTFPLERLFFKEYAGHCFLFNSIIGFELRNITIVNPVVYGVHMAYVENFTVEDIRFEYNEGSPKLWNMDGVHLDGGCRNGVVRNLQGACHDDLVALTSDDGVAGPIENVVVDGIYAEGCHSAVRLLSVKNPLRNVHVTNVFGTYYAYAIIISKYVESEYRSGFENITIDHVYASLCPGTVDVEGNFEPLITIGRHLDIRKLSIAHVYRRETHCPMPLIGLREGSTISELSLEHIEQINLTDQPIALLQNDGTIKKLVYRCVDYGNDAFCIGNQPVATEHQF